MTRLRLLRRAFCALALAPLQPARADERPSDQQVKAAFLTRFGAYVEWPDDAGARADAPLQIGVLGSDPLAQELEQQLRGRKVGERVLQLVRLKSGDSLKGLHMLFIGPGSPIPAPQQRGLLTVSESPPPRGAVIQFVLSEQKVRFEIDLGAAERNGLRLSSRLLAVAAKVVGGGG